MQSASALTFDRLIRMLEAQPKNNDVRFDAGRFAVSGCTFCREDEGLARVGIHYEEKAANPALYTVSDFVRVCKRLARHMERSRKTATVWVANGWSELGRTAVVGVESDDNLTLLVTASKAKETL